MLNENSVGGHILISIFIANPCPLLERRAARNYALQFSWHSKCESTEVYNCL